MVRRGLFVLAAISSSIFLISHLVGAEQKSTLKSPGKWTPTHPYNINPEAGPWAICVISYAGETAFTFSEDMVSELRRDFKLPGYFYNRSDVERQEEAKRQEEFRRRRYETMKQFDPTTVEEKIHIKKPLHIEDQFAVMIGGYKDMDSARRSLDEIRKLKSPSEKLLHKIWGTDKDGQAKNMPVNPFLTAFVCPNPSIPKERNQQPQVSQEEFETSYRQLQEMNTGESLSLLKCPGKWTLVVKVYQSPTVIQTQHNEGGFFDRAFGSKGQDFLSAAAKQAHQLGEILRSKQLNFDAYVLHAPTMSMVCVGSFNDERDPRLSEMANTMCKLRLDPYETLMQPPKPFPVPKPPR